MIGLEIARFGGNREAWWDGVRMVGVLVRVVDVKVEIVECGIVQEEVKVEEGL